MSKFYFKEDVTLHNQLADLYNVLETTLEYIKDVENAEKSDYDSNYLKTVKFQCIGLRESI